MTGGNARGIVLALAGVAILAGGFFFVRNFQRSDEGRAPNVAEEPAGGRTQAEPDADAPVAVDAPGDPLLPGVPEAPDVPANSAHAGIKKVGERIKDAVLADGTVGDKETPGVDFTGLTQKQRRWFLDHAIAITCSCGCGQDLLECRRDDVNCPLSPGLADSLRTVALRQ